jgi:hypothetical protein
MALVLVLGLALTACGDDDDGGPGPPPMLSEPEVAGSIDNQDLVADQDPVEIDISDLFDGEELTLSASSSDSGVATASVDGTTLTVDPQNGGTATVTVTAENDAGSADTSFEASVILPTGPDPPNGS